MSDFQLDPILTAQHPTANNLILVEQNGFRSIDLVTPIGRFLNMSVDQPRAVQGKDEPDKPADPRYSITLAIAPFGADNAPLLSDLNKAICMLADAEWPALRGVNQDGQSGEFVGSKMFGTNKAANQLHYPLRNGDEKYHTDPAKFAAYRGVWFFNAAMRPQTRSGNIQHPIVKNARGMDMPPHEIAALCKPGCYGRASLRVIPFTYKEKNVVMSKGVTFLLQGVQYWRAGPSLGGYDMSKAVGDAFAGAGELPVMDGPNTAIPAAIPGWAQPEPGYQFGPAGGQAAQPQPSAPIPPNPAPQGYPRSNSGARPPGV
jgi:hypothetical protein